MAGRGRGATLPAWMKEAQHNGTAPTSTNGNPPPGVDGQYDNADENGSRRDRDDRRGKRRSRSRSNDGRKRSRDKTRDRSSRDERSSGDRHKSRSSRSHRSSRRRRSKSSSKARDSDRRRRSRYSKSRSRSKSSDKPRRRRRKKSNFDVRPPGVTEENAAAYAAQIILQQNMAALSGAVGPASFGPPQGTIPPGAHGTESIQQTRHARRIYVGGIGDVNEADLTIFFNDVIDRALGKKEEGGQVVSVYINMERHFAFVELKTIELTTACMNLDGISFNGNPLKIRRPNDYNPALIPNGLGKIPELNLSALGIVGTTVPDGPGKIFVGGLPYHLSEDQVKELLQAFGPLKSFHLVKETGSNLSKGYAFCEYSDPSVTSKACEGLNDLALGDKTLTVRRAMPQGGDINPDGTIAVLGIDAQQAAMQTMSMAGVPGANSSVSQPTRVLVLNNMVTVEELTDDQEYDDIVDDIRTECSNYGEVRSILIPRPGGDSVKAVGKVFVEYADVKSAQQAASELHGRGFSSRIVAAEFLSEDKYAAKDLV